jgi:hypothetical protein
LGADKNNQSQNNDQRSPIPFTIKRPTLLLNFDLNVKHVVTSKKFIESEIGKIKSP